MTHVGPTIAPLALNSNFFGNVMQDMDSKNVNVSSSSSYNYSSHSSKTVVTNDSALQAEENVAKR